MSWPETCKHTGHTDLCGECRAHQEHEATEEEHAAEVRALRASAYEERKEAMRDYQRLNKELTVRCEEIAALRAEVEGLKGYRDKAAKLGYKMQDQRDAARAWAKRWKAAAKAERSKHARS